MKILMTCDPEIPVPPRKYGGVERLVSGLCKEYTRMGHEVWLVANRESIESSVKEIFGWEVSRSRGRESIIRNGMQLRKIVRRVRPDVIHSFSRLLYLYPMFLSGMRSTPVLQTYGRAISRKSTAMAARVCGKNLHFCCCGAHMLRHLNDTSNWNVGYNFTDTNYFTPGDKRREYLAFLGRIEDIKGTHEAIQVARKAAIPLVIAGNVQPEHEKYFREKVEPYLDGVNIRYIGPVDDAAKRELLQGARAFLFPIKWEEPFGIVMIEAMACGAPVLAFRRGSVPEVVIPGTGFISDTVDEMAADTRRLDECTPGALHNYVRTNFSREAIASHYISLFNRFLSEK